MVMKVEELKTVVSLVAEREKKNEWWGLILFWVNVMDMVLAHDLLLQTSQWNKVMPPGKVVDSLAFITLKLVLLSSEPWLVTTGRAVFLCQMSCISSNHYKHVKI